MNVRVVERALAAVGEQSAHLGDGRRIGIEASLERIGELEQLGPDCRDPVAQQQFKPPPAAVAVQGAIGGLSEAPRESATPAGADRPRALARAPRLLRFGRRDIEVRRRLTRYPHCPTEPTLPGPDTETT